MSQLSIIKVVISDYGGPKQSAFAIDLLTFGQWWIAITFEIIVAIGCVVFGLGSSSLGAIALSRF